MERKSLPNDPCPIARSLDVVGDWWTLLIIRDALAGVTRFNTFQRCLGVARNSLSARLTALVERGLLEKRPASDGSAFMEHVLTAKGQALAPVLIGAWSSGASRTPEDPRKNAPTFVDRRTNRRLRTLRMQSSDGKLLHASDIVGSRAWRERFRF
jgi:DNA-binding HxlR family transcriptional regulator